MKHLHKFASVLLALVMAFSLMAPAFASGTAATGGPTITINKATVGHTYDAYQIFKGDLATNGENKDVLSNVEWGSGVLSDAAALAAARTVAGLENAQNAAEVAAILANGYDVGDGETKEHKTVDAAAFAQAMGKDSVLSNIKFSSQKVAENQNTATINCAGENGGYGYYLIKDNTDNPTNPDGDAVSLFMLQVVGPTTVDSKVGTPTPDKKIVEGANKVNTTDKNIGDTVVFELSAELGGNYENYKTYKLVFHDTMSAGLTYDTTKGVTVTVEKKDGSTQTVNTNGLAITEKGAVNWAVGTPDADGQVTLTLTFTDLKSSIPGLVTGDKILVTYQATLNEEAVIGNPGNPNKMHLEYSNNPNDGHDGDTDETLDKEVLVFTYELDNNKVDGQDETIKLAGAEFVLKNSEDKFALINKTTWKLVKWVDSEVKEENEDGNTTTLVSDNNGLFKVIGLDQGTYTLEETKAPAGYNLPNPATTTIVISATIKETNGVKGVKDALTALTIKVGDGEATNGNLGEGSVSTTIKNNKGAVLPETGGIGTTIFYVVGGLLTVGAVVLLVTKKRMSADSDK